ncbi:hypothetical protein OKW30_008317 [Paraburkholderia sp. Clong3]
MDVLDVQLTQVQDRKIALDYSSTALQNAVNLVKTLGGDPVAARSSDR